MNLQLHHVVTDITGVTGMAIIRAIVAGERDPSDDTPSPKLTFGLEDAKHLVRYFLKRGPICSERVGVGRGMTMRITDRA